MDKPMTNLLEFHPKEQRGIIVLLIILIITCLGYLAISFLHVSPPLESELSEEEFMRLVTAHKLTIQSIEDELSSEHEKSSTVKYTNRYQNRQQDWAITPTLEEDQHWEHADNPNWTVYPNKTSTVPNQTIEINSVDSIQLVSIKGIGPYTAHKILSYREKLGGYADTQQLREIYKIDTALFNQTTTTFVCNSQLIRPILLNTATYEEIARHPYIKTHQARALIAYRKMHGSFRSLQDLQNCAAMDAQTCQRLAPYLRIE
jgi:DNA uptake protein ComE-like DNA-binding protein